ncbi:Oxidation resistance protein [Pseudoloma neurophilia]|uniref:Oxidation resistance protein 1 n=1 Tax=Pseudoloma neurophilia TaxID=146866 RepID=A0A0R0LRK4_9MICR|nr:Oxidation resistance protein [Pseudoloma neurophilia]
MSDLSCFFRLVYKKRDYRMSILDKSILENIVDHLESKYKVAESWTLVYSSKEHGFSLRTMIHMLENYIPPYVLICETIHGEKFGVFIDDKITFSNSLKGKNNTFLFKYQDQKFKSFNYTGKFPYFCLCDKNYMGFGCSDGKFALVLDSTLLKGTTASVSTFENEKLAATEKFQLKDIEVWQIGF